jgi:GT2 family glycosyltransferase
MSSATALVSVIIPTYNRAYCLEQTLRSVFDQSHTPLEVIVVDDGSTDETGDLCIQMARRDGRLRYMRQANAGVSAARNTGIGAVTGDYVAFLDSDDLWKPWKIEVQLAAFAAVPELGMVWTDMEAVDPQGHVKSSAFLRQFYSAYRHFPIDKLFSMHQPWTQWLGKRPIDVSFDLHVGSIYSAMIMGNMVHTSTALLRRERLDAVGGFRLELRDSGEDYDFHLRTCREGLVGLIDAPAIYYRVGHDDQLTQPRYAWRIAYNFLRTVEDAIARDGDRITLPAHMIRSVRAEARSWVGDVSFRQGDMRSARKYLLSSLRYRLWNPRAARLLLASILPKTLRNAISAHRLRRRRLSTERVWPS